MADENDKTSAPPDSGDEDDVKTAVETVDAKRAAQDSKDDEDAGDSEADERASTPGAKAAAGDGDAEPKDGGRDDDAKAREDEDDEDDEDDDAKASEGEDEVEAPKPVAAKPKAKAKAKPDAATSPRAGGAYRAAPPAHDAHHGLAHVMPIKLLVGILAILLVLTVATVAVTAVDLGSTWNLVVAMVIATIKAALVIAFFMHLIWDRKFNLLVFMSSVLFLALFLALSLTDRREYQHDIDQREADQAALNAQ